MPHQEFLEKYQEIHAPFVRYCSGKAYGIMDAADLVQDAVLIALKDFENIRDKDKLLSFMIGVVNNIIRNKKRKLKFRGTWDDQLLEKLESQTTSPEVAMDIHILLKALDQLPIRQKEALLLFELSGFSIREISALQNSSEAATKTRLSRARQLLRKRLSDQTRKPSLSATLAAYTTILF